MSYEPSKRLFLMGLPKDVTRKDIVDFIKLRTRANPVNIEIGLDCNGAPKGYAHATVEGLKNVIESVNDVPMRGHRISAFQAKPHFSVAIVQVRRDNERYEREEAARLQKELDGLAEKRAAALATETGDSEEANALRKMAAPKNPVEGLLRWATVQAEVAAASRANNKRVREAPEQPPQQQHGGYNNNNQGGYQGGYNNNQGGFQGGYNNNNQGGYPQGGQGDERRAPAPRTEQAPAPKVEKAPPPPPPPSKEERKLSSLQIKLAALQAKLKKK
jgi:hypothetical protein